MYIYPRRSWGARPARSWPGTRITDDQAVVHWSGSKITPGGKQAGDAEALPPKPGKPGLKWYRLWRNPDSPKAQRRKISRVIRKYNRDLREWKAATRDMDTSPTPKHILEQEREILRGFQRYHMDAHGWSDIGYHFAIFASGNVYACRNYSAYGAHALGANHSTGIVFVMGPGDEATSEMLSSFYRLIQDKGIRRFRGHNQVPGNATACPGPDLTAKLRLPVGY